MKLKELSNKIYNDLKLSQYYKEKEFIKKCFQNQLENQFYTVKLRLHVLDSLYSTQMSKRLYGLEELAESIAQYSDEILIEESQKVLIGKYSEILEAMFSNKYGYDSVAQKQKKAVSLISKYLYFLTNYEFPIYDSLVKIAYPKVIAQYNLKTEYPKITDANFVKALSQINEMSGINNFEKLDNYLWYSEKVVKKSYSLIYSKEDHLRMIKIKE